MVFLTFTIGVLNLCLGFALAVKLGYGPPTLRDGWNSLLGAAGHGDDDNLPEDLSAMLADEADLDALLDDEPGDDLDDDLADLLAESPVAEDEEATAAQSHETLDPGVPENWNLDEKFVETSVLKLNIAMMKSGARATEIDTRLRAARGHSDAETIRACLALLKEDCQTYLAEQSKAADAFHDRIGELGELSALGDEIEMTNLEQAAQIETTLSNLDNMDFETDLEAANKRLLEEISLLRRARHKLRDSQDEAFLAIARNENRIGKIEKQLYQDPLTKLTNRIGLEGTLHEWWKAGKPRSHPMSAALFDIDHFERINEKHGSLVGDKILNRLAEFVRGQCGSGDLVARFAGQRFFVMMCDVGPRAAVKKIELIRQGIEKAVFLRDTEEIHVTAAGALTEVTPDDTEQSVFQRLKEAIGQAKHAGPNHSFVHDGSKIERIESPNLGAKYAEFRI